MNKMQLTYRLLVGVNAIAGATALMLPGTAMILGLALIFGLTGLTKALIYESDKMPGALIVTLIIANLAVI
ncbi:MAG TPA: hypothetical protein VHX44_19915, partial [Planctomycetota bacterium]|nr:hypothetical protein [Planctomycetota bacterium]